MARRPSIKAHRYANANGGNNEYTAEFSSRFGGGLINVWEQTNGDERTKLAVYRTDITVDVIVGRNDEGQQPNIYVDQKRAPDLRKLRELLEGLATSNAGPAVTSRDGSVTRPTEGEGNHILVRREDWEALVRLRAFMDGEEG